MLQDQDTHHKIFLKGADLNDQVKLFADCEGAIQKEFKRLELKTKSSKKISKSAIAKESINASQIFFPGLMHSFIATKVPTDDSMLNFWKMVEEKEVTTIVMLTPLEKNTYVNFKAKYLPTKEELILTLKNGISLEQTEASFNDFWEKR